MATVGAHVAPRRPLGGPGASPVLAHRLAAGVGLANPAPTIALSADADDWHPRGLAFSWVVRVQATGARRVSGLAVPALWRETPGFRSSHRRLWVCLVDGGPLTFVGESPRSQAPHRFAGPTFMVAPQACVGLVYDAVSQRWRRVASPTPQ